MDVLPLSICSYQMFDLMQTTLQPPLSPAVEGSRDRKRDLAGKQDGWNYCGKPYGDEVSVWLTFLLNQIAAVTHQLHSSQHV